MLLLLLLLLLIGWLNVWLISWLVSQLLTLLWIGWLLWIDRLLDVCLLLNRLLWISRLRLIGLLLITLLVHFGVENSVDLLREFRFFFVLLHHSDPTFTQAEARRFQPASRCNSLVHPPDSSSTIAASQIDYLQNQFVNRRVFLFDLLF